MHILVLIRKLEKSDELIVGDIVKNYIMDHTKEAIIFCLFREITLQLIVLVSAIAFIFFGVPLPYCLLCIPFVIGVIIISVYISYFNNAVELNNEPFKESFVAEIYEPHLMRSPRKELDYSLIENYDSALYPLNKMRKVIAGTMSIKQHSALDSSAWIFRTAVNPEYNFSKISEFLLRDVLNYCRERQYSSVETVTLECHENAREMYIRNGFCIRQVYHKNYAGGAFKIMKSQLGLSLEKPTDNDLFNDYMTMA